MENGAITRKWSGTEFFSMDDGKRISLGLRELHGLRDCGEKINRTEPFEKPSLEIKNLTLAYKKRIVQKSLSFSLAQGEILGITGVNGVGKTTLLRTLAGLIKAQSGSVTLDGRILKERGRRRRFGMVMQDVNYQLFSDSCENECRLGNPDIDPAAAKALLSKVNLLELAEHHPQSLSGGQKQRLALAVCNASDKDVLLLDEPTSGLDYASMCAVRDVLCSLADEGKIVLIVTHDLEFAEMVCHRFIHLQRS